VLVATDYFTKWTEAITLKNKTHGEVIQFILEHIMEQGSSFMSHQVRDFTESLKIKLLSSSPYYAHANDQAEPSNKTNQANQEEDRAEPQKVARSLVRSVMDTSHLQA
jgi:hypothetical protein